MFFNDNWLFYKDGHKEEGKRITLPHDARINEKRDINNPGGVNVSYFAGGKYHYEKDFSLSLKDGDRVYFEFEGIYRNGKIFLNGKEAYYRPYGYSDFYFDATDFVKNGENHREVIADNSNQPNSRWYSGSGIYRPVHLYILPKRHILPRTLKIKTTDYQKGRISLACSFSEKGNGRIEIRDRENKVVFQEEFQDKESLNEAIQIPHPQLWDRNHPYLYTAKVSFAGQDEAESTFGIRQVLLSVKEGLLLNGKRVILYGACIHHDNGLLGAIDNKTASFRKVGIRKKAGYNAIRSAHNPISQTRLEACDRLGRLVRDEFADCWYIHKTKYDYASFGLEYYKQDLKDRVDKDYNHPCVILYSEGNEVAETSQKKGIEFVKTRTDYLHSMDDTRPCTCGINIFFNALFSWGFGVYSDKKAEKNAKAKPKQKKKSVGSEFFNKLAGLLGADFRKTGATLPQSDRKTRGAFAQLDVAGYNYGIKRYKHDLKKYPDRFILGSETFCADAGKFYARAANNPRLIGDFVWSGWDYIGEAGVGSWVACENEEIKDDKAGWLLAGSGRIDILGDENAERSYTRTAFRQETISLACVSPKDYALGHSPSSWKFSWALSSYDFKGYENKKTEAEIYSQADFVELYQNGKRIAKKKKGSSNDGYYRIKIKYIPGTLMAIAYDKNHKEIGRSSLTGSGKETVFSAVSEKEKISDKEISFLKLAFTDKNGQVKPLENDEIEVVSRENCSLLGLGNGCPYYKGSYLDKKTVSYYGKAQAILKPTIEEGIRKITFRTKYGDATASVSVYKGSEEKDLHI